MTKGQSAVSGKGQLNKRLSKRKDVTIKNKSGLVGYIEIIIIHKTTILMTQNIRLLTVYTYRLDCFKQELQYQMSD